MLPRRQARINELVRKGIGDILERGVKTNSPGLITITHVKVSPDLSAAWVEFTVIGADEEAALRFLEKSRHEIIGKLAQKVRLRSLPRLNFAPDRVSKNVEKIEGLIREIHRDEDETSD